MATLLKQIYGYTNSSKEEPLQEEILQEDEHSKKIDTKLSALPYYFTYTIPSMTLLGTYLGGWYNFITLIYVFVVLPILELLGGTDGYNPSKEECKYLEKKLSFKLVTWIWVPLNLFLVIFGAYMAHQYWNAKAWAAFVGVTLSVGTSSGGIGITIAHELIHKLNRFEQNLGKILLLCSLYMHFYIEHLLGHHKRVATEEDPATARLGESLYAFIPRSVIGSYQSAWKIEEKRLSKLHISVWSYQNQMLQFLFWTVAFSSMLYYFFGLSGFIFFLTQGTIGFLLLEIVNYIEHYGLQRKEIGKEGSGRYEQVTPLHSWNADQVITNYLIFKLQRHADHHTWPYRRYPTLRSWDFSPQLPTGYLGMMLLAMVPPLYKSVMDPKVLKYRMLMSDPSAEYFPKAR